MIITKINICEKKYIIIKKNILLLYVCYKNV